jgi:nicotinate-nucleotide--dimethylbenzimidazole phosphoribosyltransferase
MVENFLAGGAAINVFARHNGLQLQVIDAGVAHDFGARAGLVDAKIAFGTRNYLEQAAMSAAERDAAIARGAALAGARRSGLPGDRFRRDGDRQHRRRFAADASAHRHATGRLRRAGHRPRRRRAGAQTGAAGTAAAARSLPPDADALSVLAEFGGFEIAMMSGAMLAAAERGCCC